MTWTKTLILSIPFFYSIRLMLNISQSLCLLDTHALVVLEKVLKSTCAKLGVSENYNNIHYIICTSYIIHRSHTMYSCALLQQFFTYILMTQDFNESDTY